MLPARASAINRDRQAVMRYAGKTATVDRVRFEARSGGRAVLVTLADAVLLDEAVCHDPHQNWHGRRV